ncbi:MAG: hypothetical protein GXO55_00415 [Chloroflexi bacterium]|nr:hypothetical protein [Chloroflexota bacterium]
MRTRARRWGVGLAGVFALFLVHAYRIYGTDVALIDDAFIFFRYARHWAEGLGLVWNRGEPPVEGVSSLLYTALLALGVRLGWDVVVWATVLNGLLALASLGLVVALARHLLPEEVSPLWSVVPALLLALSPEFAFWAGAGMDSMLFLFLLLLSVWLMVEERWGWAGVGFALLGMTRLDSVPLFLFAWLLLGWREWKGGDKAPLLRMGVGFIGLFLPFFLARWVYFGWPLPNTFYAKMGGGWAAWREGIAYVLMFLRRPGIALALILAAWGAWRGRTWPTILVFGFIPLLLIRAILAGGDWMPHFRLLLPVLPFLYVMATYALVSNPLLSSRWVGLVLVGGILLGVVSPSLHVLRTRPWRLWRPVRLVEPMHASQYAMGLALRDRLCPEDTVALLAVGAAAYLNDDHIIIDMLGLNDVHIAHSPPVLHQGQWDPGHVRLDVDYILRRSPEWIQLDTHLFDSPHFRPRDWMPVRRLWSDPRVRARYELVPLRVEVPTDYGRPRVGYIFFLHRKDAPTCDKGGRQ